MKSSITALCIAAGLFGTGLTFAATPAASAAAPAVKATPAVAATPATPAAPAAKATPAASTDAVTTPAKKKVKKHATKKPAKKASAAS
jgi:hypothetical protein